MTENLCHYCSPSCRRDADATPTRCDATRRDAEADRAGASARPPVRAAPRPAGLRGALTGPDRKRLRKSRPPPLAASTAWPGLPGPPLPPLPPLPACLPAPAALASCCSSARLGAHRAGLAALSLARAARRSAPRAVAAPGHSASARQQQAHLAVPARPAPQLGAAVSNLVRSLSPLNSKLYPSVDGSLGGKPAAPPCGHHRRHSTLIRAARERSSSLLSFFSSFSLCPPAFTLSGSPFLSPFFLLFPPFSPLFPLFPLFPCALPQAAVTLSGESPAGEAREGDGRRDGGGTRVSSCCCCCAGGRAGKRELMVRGVGVVLVLVLGGWDCPCWCWCWGRLGLLVLESAINFGAGAAYWSSSSAGAAAAAGAGERSVCAQLALKPAARTSCFLLPLSFPLSILSMHARASVQARSCSRLPIRERSTRQPRAGLAE